MKIGIDARLYTQTGVGVYVRNLIAHLIQLDRDNQYLVYLRQEDFDAVALPGDQWRKVLLDIPWHSLQEQIQLPLRLYRDHLDVMHFPYFSVPLGYNRKYLITVHDLIIDHFDTGRASKLPLVIYKMKRFAYQMIMAHSLTAATQIAVVSETTRTEVMHHYVVDPQLVTITYDALDESFRDLVATYQPKRLMSGKYFLAVGNAYPHKNLERLLQAMVQVRKKADCRLVLVGDDGHFYRGLRQVAKQLGVAEVVQFFGHASQQQLIDLYSHTTALVFPSLMEGFGLPAFEVLACGKLPILSDIPVFHELWHPDMSFFDPTNSDDIAEKMLSILTLSPAIYHQRVQRLQKNIQRFSWEHTARQTLELYRKVAAGKRD